MPAAASPRIGPADLALAVAVLRARQAQGDGPRHVDHLGGMTALDWARTYAQLAHPIMGRLAFADVIRDYQHDLLADRRERIIIVKARQIGISQTLAFIAAHEALRGGTVLVVSRTGKQAALFLQYVYTALLDAPHPPYKRQNQETLEFEGAGAIYVEAASPGAGRGIPASLVILDEMAWMEYGDAIYTAVMPTLSNGGRAILCSTPYGRNNLFYRIWAGGDAAWGRHELPWRRRKDWAADPDWERAKTNEIGREAFAQEYGCHCADTRIVAADGRRPRIIDLDIGTKILTYQPQGVVECTITDKRMTGVRPLLRVRTEADTTFTATNGHPIITSCGVLPLEGAPDLQYVPATAYVPDRAAALARIVGYNIGDGTIAQRRARRRARLDGSTAIYAGYPAASFYSKDRDDLVRLSADIVRAGLAEQPPAVLLKRGNGTERHPDSYQVHLSPAASARLVQAGCPVGQKVEQAFDVPAWIVADANRTCAEFLAALWGAEGTTPLQASRGKANTQLVLRMHKRERAHGAAFFETLVALHHRLGVDATYSVRASGSGWAFSLHIAVQKENVRRFFERIGYRYAARKERIAFQWFHYYGAHRCDAARRNRPQAARNFPRFADWLAERWRDGALYLKVTAREQLPEAPVYNIAVDSPDHTYLLADGLNNHNCDFAVSGGAVFDPADLDAFLCLDGLAEPDQGRRYLTAWDIGRRQDATVGVTFDRTAKPYRLVAYDRFLHLPYPDVQAAIEARHRRYPGATVVESNGVGDPVIQNLRVRVEEFVTTARTKKDAIDALQLGLQRRDLQAPDLDQMRRELTLYQRDDKDLVQDVVMALAMAAYRLLREAPVVAPANITRVSPWGPRR